MRKAEDDADVCGLACMWGGPRVNHLLFADDSLIFYRDKMSDYEAIQTILSDYSRASGQCVNFEKSLVQFSPNIREDTKVSIVITLGIVRSTT